MCSQLLVIMSLAISIFSFLKASVKDTVFEALMYFVEHDEEDVRHKALTGIGKRCYR